MSKVKKCVGKESFARMNYLYQLSNLSLKNKTASTLYTDLLLKVARKSVQRLEPEIKRTICKGCCSLLVPGETCRVRIKKKVSVWTCLTCKLPKRFQLKKDYKLWIEEKESIVELYNYKQNLNIAKKTK